LRFARRSPAQTCGSCRTKTPERQSCLTPHHTRHLFIRQQTASRARLAEFGIVAPVGRNGIEQSPEVVADAKDTRLLKIARACVTALGTQLLALKAQIPPFDRRIMAWHRSSETSKRLDEIPRVGPALATALAASDRGVTSRPGLRPSRTRSACGAGRVDTKNTAIAGQQQQNPQTAKAARSYVRSIGNGSPTVCLPNNRRAIMSRKLAMSFAAAFILSSAFWSFNADAGVQYHGGPKSPGTISVGAN
jgi:hypothetical protein